MHGGMARRVIRSRVGVSAVFLSNLYRRLIQIVRLTSVPIGTIIIILSSPALMAHVYTDGEIKSEFAQYWAS